MDRPRTSLAGVFIAVTAIALALGYWINSPTISHPSPLPPLFAVMVISFCGGLLTPYRWVGILLGTIAACGWAESWMLTKFGWPEAFSVVLILPYVLPTVTAGAFMGGWLRSRLSVAKIEPPPV